MQHAARIEVVGVFALARNEGGVFPPLDRLSQNTHDRLLRPFGGSFHRLDDVVIPGATAQVASQTLADLLL